MLLFKLGLVVLVTVAIQPCEAAVVHISRSRLSMVASKGFGSKGYAISPTNKRSMEAVIQENISKSPGLRDAMTAFEGDDLVTSEEALHGGEEKLGWTRINIHNKLLELTWDAAAEFRDNRHDATALSNEMESYLSFLADIVISNYSKGTKICDVGCGTGILLKLLKAKAIKHGLSLEEGSFYGVDLSSEMIKLCRKKFANAHFQHVDFLDYKPEAAFSCIVFNECLHNFIDIRIALSHAANLLQPGGRIVISHPRGYSNVLVQHRANKWLVPSILPSAEEWDETLTSDLGLQLVMKPSIKSSHYLAALVKC